jgi:hypothetical protein
MKFTMIIQKLRDMRMSVDSRLAEQARGEYGATFNTHFTYRRGGQEFVMTKASAVAKRYIELTGKGLA